MRPLDVGPFWMSAPAGSRRFSADRLRYTAAMLRALAVLLALPGLVACRPTWTPLYRHAPGSEIDAERGLGRCRIPPGAAAVVRREVGGTLRAGRPGDARLRCQRGRLRLEVREVARIAIAGGSDSAPGMLRPGQPVRLVAQGQDARGFHLILAGVPLVWEPRGVMEQIAPPGCTAGDCRPDGSAWFHALQPGGGSVHVRYRDLGAAALFQAGDPVGPR